MNKFCSSLSLKGFNYTVQEQQSSALGHHLPAAAQLLTKQIHVKTRLTKSQKCYGKSMHLPTRPQWLTALAPTMSGTICSCLLSKASVSSSMFVLAGDLHMYKTKNHLK